MEPHITSWNLAGVNQFAYTEKRGLRDAPALLVLRWIDALDKGRKVLVYWCDVSAAFDKVPQSRLMKKLEAKGIHPKLLKLIGSWLEPRRASVVFGGGKSEPVQYGLPGDYTRSAAAEPILRRCVQNHPRVHV